MSRSASPVSVLRRRLGRLRRRIRALFAVQGLARWLVAAFVALLLFFVADWLLDLPIGVRRFVRLGLLDRPGNLGEIAWILMLGAGIGLTIWATRRRLGAAPVFAFATGGIAGILVWLGARVLSPLRASLSDESLALSVEQRFRRLNDRLAAALDFETELAHPTRGESAAMMEVVLGEAAEEAKGLEFARAVSGRRALAWIGATVAAIVVAGGVALAAPDTVDLWARRSILLEDVSWPRATTVVAVDVDDDGVATQHPAARPFSVSVGRPFLVHAQALGKAPDEVQLVDRVEGSRPLPRRMFPVPDREGLYRLEIRDVRRAFSFVLKGGDDVDEEPVYQVDVTVPPRAIALTALLVYPPYLGRADETVEGGDHTVPEGTTVKIEFETDVPVRKANALLKDQAVPAEATGADGRHFAFTFMAERSLRYRILLETEDGRKSDPAADTYEVKVREDRPPRPRWVFPRGPLDVTPGGLVPILAAAADDHAIKGLVLELQSADGKTRQISLEPYETGDPEPRGDPEPGDANEDQGATVLAALDGPYGRAEVRAYAALEVSELVDAEGRPPLAPARLAARFAATDSKGQTTLGTWTLLEVRTPIDVERTLADRRSGIRTELVAILVEQQGRREQLAGLLSELGEVPPPGDGPAPALDDVSRDLLKSVQFAQAKIAQDTHEAVRRLTEVFNAWVHGRLGAENPTARVLAIFDRHHRNTYGASEDGDEVFPYELYNDVVAAWRDRSIFDTGILDRMLLVLSEAVDVAARKAPAAQKAAVGAVEGSVPIPDVLAAQDAVIAGFERVLAAVQSWQSLSEVVRTLRRIIERQEALDELLREVGTR